MDMLLLDDSPLVSTPATLIHSPASTRACCARAHVCLVGAEGEEEEEEEGREADSRGGGGVPNQSTRGGGSSSIRAAHSLSLSHWRASVVQEQGGGGEERGGGVETGQSSSWREDTVVERGSHTEREREREREGERGREKVPSRTLHSIIPPSPPPD